MPAPPYLSRGVKYLILLLPLLLIFAYITSFATPARYRRPISSVRRPSYRDPTDWWIEFFARLQTTRVDAPPIAVKGRVRGENWRPDINNPRPELIALTDEIETKFRESHASFIKQLAEFARHLPYQAGTTGIVTTAGAASFGQAVSLVLLTRQTGSRLPIQIVLDSSAPWVDFVCATEMARLNATCLYISDVWAKLYPFIMGGFERFQWKVIALIASTFQDVLFLDADCFPVLNPDPIFEKGAEPFTSTGFITWPDFWTPSASSLFYKIAGDIEVPPLMARTTSESGVMVYDKARHADTLLLAAYYNYNGPGHYYTMLTQGGPGEGDKETFLQAALVLDTLRQKGVYDQPTEWMKPGVGVKKGYWDVKTLPRAHGRTEKGKLWRGMFMQQMGPAEDYRKVMAAVDAQGASGRDTTTNPEPSPKTTSSKKGDPNNPTATPAAPLAAAAAAAYLTNSTFLSTLSDLPLPPSTAARPMFFHHNGVKPDLTRILDPGSGLLGRGDDGRLIRMWGDPGWIAEAASGRDVERLWWEASIGVYCAPGMGVWWGEVCRELRRVFGEVYL